ncbi:MAG: nitroreductase family protein [Firmicutes bacterium]|nr:nitroreductase family protein [Bacillota bacterium]
MTLRELVLRNRSYRRFREDIPVEYETLQELVDLARYTASAGNKQPLKYLLSYHRRWNEIVFPCLAWAGYLTDWPGPAEGERPGAYILVLGDTTLACEFGYEAGIAAQTILLGAVERGLGGCIIGGFDRATLRARLEIPSRYEILLVLALGVPAETVVLEEPGPDGDIRYWRDEAGVHHVPKRRLSEIILVPPA